MNRSAKASQNPNPHDKASRLSKMAWWWLRDLYKTGYSRPITEDDIYTTINHYRSERVGERFANIWSDEVKSGKPSVFSLFYRAYGNRIMFWGILFSLCETLNRCFQPLLLGSLLDFFSSDGTMPKSEAYFYAAGITFCSLVPVLTFSPYIFYVFETSLKLRVGSSRLIYDKVSAKADQTNDTKKFYTYSNFSLADS